MWARRVVRLREDGWPVDYDSSYGSTTPAPISAALASDIRRLYGGGPSLFAGAKRPLPAELRIGQRPPSHHPPANSQPANDDAQAGSDALVSEAQARADAAEAAAALARLQVENLQHELAKAHRAREEALQRALTAEENLSVALAQHDQFTSLPVAPAKLASSSLAASPLDALC